MAYSTQSAVSDGTLSVLPLSIDYLSRDDISVYLGSLPAPTGAWSWVGTTDKTISFAAPVPYGVVVTVKRATKVDALYHKFSGGAQFTSKTLDESLKQTLYVAQEFAEVGGVASDEMPLPVGAQAAPGFSTKFARADHVHVGMTGGSVGSVVCDTFAGDGTKLTFDLSNTPTSKGSTQVYVDNVYQAKAVYSLAGNHLTFDEAPATGAVVEVVTVIVGGGRSSDIAVNETADMLNTNTGGNVQGALAWVASQLKFVQAYTGAVVRTLWAKMFDMPVSPRDFGAVGNGVADDSNAIELCANSGARRIDYGGLTYKITRQIKLYTSGVTHDMRGAQFTQTSTNTDAFLIGYNGGFVKTDDITFIGGSITGADNGLTTTVSTGIGIYPPPAVPYVAGAGCSRIKVEGTRIDSFCIGLAATGADELDLDVRVSNVKYHASASAGGYGLLLQTCFKFNISGRCTFLGGATSRHAIYISADPGRAKDANNVCKRGAIGACWIDWSAVTGVTGFEAAIYIRGAFDVSVNGPVIYGSFGGVVYDLENAPGENISIANVVATGIRGSGAGEVAGVQFTRSSGTYRCKNVAVSGCTIQVAHANVHGIQLGYIDGVSCGGNTVGRPTDACLSSIYTVACTDVVLNPSRVAGNYGYGAIIFALTCDNVQISRHVFTGSGPKYKFFSVPTNLRFNYPRSFTVTANGSGSVVASSSDGEVLTASVVSEPNGFTVTFQPEISTAVDNFAALSMASQVANVYHRAATSNTVTFGVLGVAAGVLSALPAASNGYAVQIGINH